MYKVEIQDYLGKLLVGCWLKQNIMMLPVLPDQCLWEKRTRVCTPSTGKQEG